VSPSRFRMIVLFAVIVFLVLAVLGTAGKLLFDEWRVKRHRGHGNSLVGRRATRAASLIIAMKDGTQ